MVFVPSSVLGNRVVPVKRYGDAKTFGKITAAWYCRAGAAETRYKELDEACGRDDALSIVL